METKSYKEQRIRNITSLYYSKPEIQKIMFQFSKNREVSPRYFEGFGKRPDSLQYPGDIFEMVKKGATSFHCSEELWEDPLRLTTGLNEKQLNELRIGWDLLIDIDSKYIDYSKISAEIIIDFLKFHGIKNIGIKFSGSKGFHLLVPFKAFPEYVNGIPTKDMFPEWARIVTNYITEKIKPQLIEKVSELSKPSKYVKDFQAPKEVMPDIILVSPRHLFRMPYSLHEKTALSSTVLNPSEIKNFELKHADPLKVEIRDFMPNSEKGEASELLMQALDWYRENKQPETETSTKEFKTIKLENLSEQNFSPCIKKILNGVADGRKRSLFVLINAFRSIGMEKQEIEQRIEEWNKKNQVPLKQGYIKSQLSWTYRKKPIMPPNCKEFYKGIGVCLPDPLCGKTKNPVNYIVKKNFLENKKPKSHKNSTKFKNNS